MTHVESAQNLPRTRGSRAKPTEATGEVNAGQLRSYVERAERLREEKKALEEDLKEVFSEARGNGYDVPTIKEILKIRAQDPSERVEKETLVDVYCTALGMS
jgi:uncharacterized protein (UPF0335 family)